MEPTAPTFPQSTSFPPGRVTARMVLVSAASAFPACSGDWSGVMLSALRLQVPALTTSVLRDDVLWHHPTEGDLRPVGGADGVIVAQVRSKGSG